MKVKGKLCYYPLDKLPEADAAIYTKASALVELVGSPFMMNGEMRHKVRFTNDGHEERNIAIKYLAIPFFTNGHSPITRKQEPFKIVLEDYANCWDSLKDSVGGHIYAHIMLSTGQGFIVPPFIKKHDEEQLEENILAGGNVESNEIQSL